MSSIEETYFRDIHTIAVSLHELSQAYIKKTNADDLIYKIYDFIERNKRTDEAIKWMKKFVEEVGNEQSFSKSKKENSKL